MREWDVGSMGRRVIRSPHDREIVRLALPALGALIAEPLYLLSDTAIVGHLGTKPLGGIAVAAIVLTAVFGIFNFLAYTTTGPRPNTGSTASGSPRVWGSGSCSSGSPPSP